MPNSGSRRFALTVTTAFQLDVSRNGKDTRRRIDVSVFPAGRGSRTVTASASCSNGSIRARGFLPPNELAPQMRVSTVKFDRRFNKQHEVEVSHGAGPKVSLGPDHLESDQLKGTEPSGEWTLSSKLLDGERCGVTSKPPPDTLGVIVQLECSAQ